ncbi:MAG: beta strand repeat-containing protein [Bdellovibrionia bacterium]
MGSLFKCSALQTALATILLGTFMVPEGANAFLPQTAFWRHRVYSLKYTTSALSVYAGNCAGVVTVRAYNPSGAPYAVPSNLTVNLSGPGTTTFYSDAGCTVPVTSVTIAAATSTANFYFIDTATSPITLTSSATGYVSASQTETLSTNPYVWTGNGGNSNWATGANWSGGSAPGSSNSALFNGVCVSNCSPTIAANINVAGIRMESVYSGTITQNSGVTITLGGWGLTQLAGTFAGGNAAMTDNGPFNLLGGSFTSTTATLTVTSDIKISNSATFAHNSGTVNFPGYSFTLDPGSAVFKNVQFARVGSIQPTLTGTMNVDGNLTLDSSGAGNSGTFNGGTVLLKGDLTVANNWNGGSTLIRLIGTTNQTITGSSTAYAPGVEIASTGGTVYFGTANGFGNNFIYTSGTIDATSAAACNVVFGGGSTLSLASPLTFNNVSFKWGSVHYNMTGTITANGDLTLDASNWSGNAGYIYGGTIHVHGNLSAPHWSDPSQSYITGSVSIVLDGSGTQTITTASGSYLPSLTLNSTGTIVFSGVVNLGKDFIYQAGTADFSGGSLYFHSVWSVTTTITTNGLVLGDVVFAGFSYTLTDVMNVGGTLTFNASTAAPSGGGINARGDVVFTTSGPLALPLTFSGSAVQNVTYTAGAVPTGTITVNKSGGSVSLQTNLSFNTANQALTLTAGSILMNGHNLTINKTLNMASGTSITLGGGILKVNGATVPAGPYGSGTIN